MKEQSDLKILFKKYIDNNITYEEFVQVMLHCDSNHDSEAIQQLIEEELYREAMPFDQEAMHAMLSRVDFRLKQHVSIQNKERTVRWRRWIPYAAAAALIVVASSIAYFFVQQASLVNQDASIVHRESPTVLPGGNKATLKLSTGEVLSLDEQVGRLITKEGKVQYSDGRSVISPDEKIYTLTLSTARKGRYEALLPDGTKVWLNAESRISYPSQFSKEERVVEIGGEVYFEVAKDKTRKFIVQLEDSKIEVLGTHFNVNAYADFGRVYTTLVEGSVKVTSLTGNSQTLRPGEQAILLAKSNQIRTQKVNTEIFTAWKHNKFNFEGQKFTEIMAQIEKWYDVDVVFQSDIPTIEFVGELSRDNSIHYIIKVFKDSGVNLRLEGNKLIVQ